MPEGSRLVILDRLRLVDADQTEMLVLELLHRAAKAAVGREHDVPRRLRQIALGTVEERYRQVRHKPRDLTLPVCEKRGRHDDEHLFVVKIAVEAQFFEHRNDLKRLAESHVVGDDGAHARAHIAHEPGIASHLSAIRSMPRNVACRWRLQCACTAPPNPDTCTTSPDPSSSSGKCECQATRQCRQFRDSVLPRRRAPR